MITRVLSAYSCSVIEAHAVNAGCSEGLAVDALAALHSASDDLFDVFIGPGCSNDVKAVGSVAARSAGGYDTVIISGASTAPSLADDSAYPNVARMSTGETAIQAGVAQVVAHFGWRRVAVVNDDSVWASESAAAFMALGLRTMGVAALS